MLCPFCLTNLDSGINTCGSCSRQLPPEYVKSHSGWRTLTNHRPAIVSVIGFRGHGKTVYLAALYYVLQNFAPKAWGSFYRQGLTMKTLQMLHENVSLLKRGDLPEATLQVFPEPNIDRLHKIPQFGDRTLLIYDPPGEAFDLVDDSLQDYARFVKHSRTALFLISLTDMMETFGTADGVAGEMDRLLERYNFGMTELEAPHKFQHLIVVYTKADRLLSELDFPNEVTKYLETGELATLHDIPKYFDGMQRNSQLLKKFTLESLNAHGFVNNATDHFVSIEYCAVSSLGSEPVGFKLSERIAPRRVMDPLLWVLKKS